MRRNNLFWGVIILLAGILLLLNTLNILTFNFWLIFWPLFLILIGFWFLLGPRLFRYEAAEEQISIPLDGASEAEIHINHGAGRLVINSAGLVNELCTGAVYGGANKQISRSGTVLSVELSMKDITMMVPFPNVDFKGFNWNLSLNRDLPIRLFLKTGAGESTVDLGDTLVKDLYIETGASSTQVTLPARAGQTRVVAKAGMAALNFQIPQGVAARISTHVGIAGIEIDMNRFPKIGDVYQSPDFDSAINKVDIEIEAGMGGIDIR
jgi:hypothetical protein